ncbi:MAG: septation protein IspZ, partial [Pseudomonadota bacterium]
MYDGKSARIRTTLIRRRHHTYLHNKKTMHFLIEFFPIIIFFVAYKFYVAIPDHIIQHINAIIPVSLDPGSATDSIYFATLVAILVSGISVVIHYFRTRQFQKNQLLTFVLFIIFGGATLLLRDPVFIKWKPTVINIVFALVFLGSAFIGEKTIAERLLGKAISVPGK